jgi:hypothetical protein
MLPDEIHDKIEEEEELVEYLDKAMEQIKSGNPQPNVSPIPESQSALEIFCDIDESHRDSPTPSTATTIEIEQRVESIATKRKCAAAGLEKQASKMLKTSNAKFKPAKIGDTVKIPLTTLDKGRIDGRNILARVMNVHEGFYQLGTPEGLVAGSYARGEFSVLKQPLLSESDIGKEVKSLRTISSEQSLCGGQGFVRCDCRKMCTSNRCKCKASNVLCNSRCHNSSTCSNKHE